MLQAQYRGWLGKTLEIRSAYHNQLNIEFKGWRDKAQWQVGNDHYNLEFPKAKGYPMAINVNGQELMRIARISIWKSALEGHYANQPLRFERPSIWKGTYQVYLNQQLIREVKAEGFWQRTITANFDSQQPFDLQLGCLVLAVTMWRREAASAAAAS